MKTNIFHYLCLGAICSIGAILTPIDLLSGLYLFIPPVICQDFNEDYLRGPGAYDAYLKVTACDGFGGSFVEYGSLIERETAKSVSIFSYDSDADPRWQWLSADKLEVTVNKLVDYDPHTIDRVGPVTIDYITRDRLRD